MAAEVLQLEYEAYSVPTASLDKGTSLEACLFKRNVPDFRS